MILIMVILPFLSLAQGDDDLIYWKRDSTDTMIRVPKMTAYQLSPWFRAGEYSSYVKVIEHDSLYYRVFNRFHRDSLPVIDFSKKELVLYLFCAQCAAYCSNNRPCHRNACSYQSIWFLRPKGSLGEQAEPL